jgi:serine/threonine-protein kinase HipA
LATFVDALTFNWLIGGTDGHAKNYFASILPYPDTDSRRIQLAMKLGDTYRIRDIAPRQFQQLAKTLELDAAVVLAAAAR